jgi:hypothetical protein
MSKPLYVKALESIYSSYITDSHKFFVKGDSTPTMEMHGVHGWDLDESIDFNPKILKMALKNDGFDKPNEILEKWKSLGIIETNAGEYGKSTWHSKEVGAKKTSMTVIRIMKSQIYKYTSIEAPEKLTKEESKKPTPKAIDPYLSSETKFMPKPQPVKSFADLHLAPMIAEEVKLPSWGDGWDN